MRRSRPRRSNVVIAWHRLPVSVCAVQALCCVLLLAGCGLPGSVKPTVKIGLSAPFEGRYRDLGYEALHAVELAVRERNAAGGIGECFLIELVALNDLNEAGEAAEQARKMAVDPAVMGVLGGWSEETAGISWEYAQLGLAYLVPGRDIREGQTWVSVDADLAARYALESGGAEPSAIALWAYSAANRLLDTMDVMTRDDGILTRARVRDALR